MLEAMATGLPVVATHHGGIPEAVTSGHDGLLVPERAPDQLAHAILSLLQDPDQWQRLSRNAATTVRQRFDSEVQVRHLENLYLEAIARARTAAAAAAANPATTP
jgi:colanic acid/amylovoran biosynthesis glycosyltransferase